MPRQQIDIFGIQQMRQAIRRRAEVAKPSCRRFLDPAFVISVAVEDDPLMVLDGFPNHIVQRIRKVIRLFEPIRIYPQRFRHGGVQHDVRARDAVGGTDHAELKLVARKRKRRGAVAVGRVPVELGQHIDAELHLRFGNARIRRIGFDRFQNAVQLISEEHGHDRGRGFVCTEPMIVTCRRHRDPQQILIIIHRFDDCAEEEEELRVIMRRFARREQILPGVGGDRPVVVLAAAVDAGKRLFMQQAYKTVLFRHALHDLHGELVMIGRHVGCRKDRRQLMLPRRNLIVLRLGKDAQLPELLVEIVHKGGDLRHDRAEIVIVHFLPLGRHCAEQRPSGKFQVGTAVVHLARDQKVFLLGTDVARDVLHGRVAEQPQNPQRLPVQRFHGSQQRCLFIERLPAVGAERRRDAERFSLDKRIGSRIPGRIAARFKRCAKSAAWEGRGVRLAFDQLLAGKLHDHASVRCAGNKAVVLFGGNARERLEPMREVCRSVLHRPFPHRRRHRVGNLCIQLFALVDRLPQRGVYRCGQMRLHHAIIKDQTAEVFRNRFHSCISFVNFLKQKRRLPADTERRLCLTRQYYI